jgi:ATP synthase protein I
MTEGRDPDREFARRIARRRKRMLRGKYEGGRGAWMGFGMFGVVGWSVVTPAVLGTLLGVWMDEAYPGPRSWTLTLLFIGVVFGCLLAWYWVKWEGRDLHAGEDVPWNEPKRHPPEDSP